MHKDRMSELGKYILPDKGTIQRELIEKNTKGKEFQKYVKKQYEKTTANIVIQGLNGANLPADKVLREFNSEYNNRLSKYSLDSMPSSFNIMEAFNKYLPALVMFKLRKERDFLFSIGDFLDYVTSDESPNDFVNIHEVMDDNVCYSFNSIDNVNEYLFSTLDNENFGIQSISMIKFKNEITMALLGGFDCDLVEKTSELKGLSLKDAIKYNDVEIDKKLEVKAVPLVENSNLWRSLVFMRFDLETKTIDIKSIYKDAGNRYDGINNDASIYADLDEEKFKEYYSLACEQISVYEPLFEFCKTALYLPYFFNDKEDLITIERHPTLFNEKKFYKNYKKYIKDVDSKEKINYRNVEKIKYINQINPVYKEFITPDFKVESSGYWKKLNFNEIGVDKNGQSIQGRTWVTKTLSWYETNFKSDSLQIGKRIDRNNKSENYGFIYVMRCASHSKDIFKVGLTRRNSETRADELSRHTSSPDKFLVVEEWEVSDCVLAEKIIHEKLDSYRINDKREFFKARYNVIFNEIINTINEVNGQ